MCVKLRSTFPLSSIARSANRDLLRRALRPLVRRSCATPPRALGPVSDLIDFPSRVFSVLGMFFLLVLGSTAHSQEAGAPLVIQKQLQMMPKAAPAADGGGAAPSATATGAGASLGAVKAEPVVRDPRVMNAARMYEKYFLGQMMKAMRSTVNKSELEKQSMGEGIYREQLDDQYVDSWSERGGIGLADMIHDELLGKAQMMQLRRQAMREAKGKTRTPMALTDRDILTVRRLPSAKSTDLRASTETVLVSLGKTNSRPEDGPETVRSSWAGKMQSIESANGKVILKIDAHKTKTEPARKIELAFDGVPFQVNVGDAIQAGQAVGQLGRSARGILVKQTLVQVPLNEPGARASGDLEPNLEPSRNE